MAVPLGAVMVIVPVVAPAGIVTVTVVAVTELGVAVVPDPLNVTRLTLDIPVPVRVMEEPMQPSGGKEVIAGGAAIAICVVLSVPGVDVQPPAGPLSYKL